MDICKKIHVPLGFLLDVALGSIDQLLHDSEIVLRCSSYGGREGDGFLVDRVSEVS